ncbi:MAG: hypothetical protein E6R04_11620 [Spirochaetes bacterium]|nr:MAG: hypothetical protein E6R04_11620 [Spirochaetota bacterium]
MFLNHTIVMQDGTLRKIVMQLPDNTEEVRLLTLICKYPRSQKHQLCKLMKDYGTHEEFESPRQRTSMRKIQQLIRNLREMGIPIVSHVSKGVWLARYEEDLREYIEWIENKARSDIASMMSVKNTLQNIIKKLNSYELSL